MRSFGIKRCRRLVRTNERKPYVYVRQDIDFEIHVLTTTYVERQVHISTRKANQPSQIQISPCGNVYANCTATYQTRHAQLSQSGFAPISHLSAIEHSGANVRSISSYLPSRLFERELMTTTCIHVKSWRRHVIIKPKIQPVVPPTPNPRVHAPSDIDDLALPYGLHHPAPRVFQYTYISSFALAHITMHKLNLDPSQSAAPSPTRNWRATRSKESYGALRCESNNWLVVHAGVRRRGRLSGAIAGWGCSVGL